MLCYMSELDLYMVMVIAVVFFGHKLYYSFNEQEPNSIVQESILKKMKNRLQNVKVNRKDASVVEVDLHRFIHWEEEAEWNHEEKIPINQLNEFLDNLLKTYRNMGVTIEDRKKWNKVHCTEDWTSKIVEWKLNAAIASSYGNQRARYGIIGFSKSTDGKFVDCIFAIYTIKFRLAPTISWRENSFLWWKSYEKIYVDKYIEKTEIEKFQNFLQLKALTAFKKEGIIENICYADETEEKTDTNTLHIN